MGKLLKIAVVGTGAIGSYYGARLAKSGVEVRFLVRSDFTQVSKHGIQVTQPSEQWTVHPVQAHLTAEEIGAVDLVIVCLKATANGVLPSLLPPLLHEGTAILTLENGLGSDDLLAKTFGETRVMGGVCFIAVNRTAPGQIQCIHPGSLSLGEYGRPATPRLAEVKDLFSHAGIRTVMDDNLAALRWKKLVWNIPFNGLSIAAGSLTTVQILNEKSLETEVRELMAEVIEAAAKLGHGIPASFIDRQIEVTRPMGPYKTSSLIDFLANREVEVEAIWGEPLRQGQAAGAKMPKLEALYNRLKKLTVNQGATNCG